MDRTPLTGPNRRALKVAYFGLACAVVFGLAAAIAGFEFGREAEDQVVDVTEDLLTIASLGGGPVLIMGLISSFARRQRAGDPMAPKRPPAIP
jgi:hypothetical protein